MAAPNLLYVRFLGLLAAAVAIDTPPQVNLVDLFVVQRRFRLPGGALGRGSFCLQALTLAWWRAPNGFFYVSNLEQVVFP